MGHQFWVLCLSTQAREYRTEPYTLGVPGLLRPDIVGPGTHLHGNAAPQHAVGVQGRCAQNQLAAGAHTQWAVVVALQLQPAERVCEVG